MYARMGALRISRNLTRLGGQREEAEVDVTDTRGELIATARRRQGRFAFQRKSGGVYLAKMHGGSPAVAKIIIP